MGKLTKEENWPSSEGKSRQTSLRTGGDSLSASETKLADIVATDELSSPSDAPRSPTAELIQHALEQRPDIGQSKLQVSNGERTIAGLANARLPEIDLYGSFQSLCVISPSLFSVGGDLTTGAPILVAIPTGAVHASQVLEAGIQFNLPVQNRFAEADLGADRALLQKKRLPLRQMEAQAAAEVRNAVIALNAAKQAAQAVATAENLQEQPLSPEAEKSRAGLSTTFAVIEQQSYPTQAETTEIADWLASNKATVQSYRALGDTLQRQGIHFDPEATKTKLVP